MSCSADIKTPTRWRKLTACWPQVHRPQTSRNQKLMTKIPEIPLCYRIINQSQNWAQADHKACDPLPYMDSLKLSSESCHWGWFRPFEHELPILLAWPCNKHCSIPSPQPSVNRPIGFAVFQVGGPKVGLVTKAFFVSVCYRLLRKVTFLLVFSWTPFLRRCHGATYQDQSCWNWTGTLVSKKTPGWVPSHPPCCASMLSTRPRARCETSGQPGQSGLPVGRTRRHLCERTAPTSASTLKGLETPKKYIWWQFSFPFSYIKYTKF